MSQQLNINLIILNWNGKEDTLECLASVEKILYPNFSIIVADNGSTDDSVAAIRNAYPDIFILENGANLGFAEGNNRAISYALDQGADAVVLLNNDTTVDASLLQAFNEAYSLLPNVGILGATCFYYDNPDVIWTSGATFDEKNCNFKYLNQGSKFSCISETAPISIDYVIGCVMFIPREVIKSVGCMDPVFFLNFEEMDWCKKIKEAGYTIYTVQNAKIWHKIASSFGGKNSPLKNYFLTRNYLLWVKKYYPKLFYKVLKKTILEFFPPAIFASRNSKPLKVRYWELINWISDCKTRFKEPYYFAQFYGLYHYFIGRFGDCPPKIKNILIKK